MQTKLNWPDIVKLVEKLSGQLAGYSPDIVVAIGEGGWIPARLLKNHLPSDYYSVRCKNYDDDNNMLEEPVITQGLSDACIRGKKVLIIDEVADSGATLAHVTSYISSFAPADLRTAVLHRKKQSSFDPDYVAEPAGDAWIVYPWEKDPSSS